MKNICKKTLVISIILLLIGVSISSAISIDTKSTISNNQSEGCRNCCEVSKSDLIEVERLLDKVEVYSKLLLVLFKYNTEVNEKIEELLYWISAIKEFNWIDFIIQVIICGTLLIIGAQFVGIVVIIENFMENHPDNILINKILNSIILLIRATIFDTIESLGEYFGCGWMP